MSLKNITVNGKPVQEYISQEKSKEVSQVMRAEICQHKIYRRK